MYIKAKEETVMPRFFVPTENIDENHIRITGSDAFHIARSLRMAVNDEITVCDMHGTAHKCRLLSIRDSECECEIIESHTGRTEPPVKITLYMGYPKGDKLELVIQKAVELGVYKIVPFESSRCIKRPKAEKAEKQNARLARISEEAAKQCGRSIIPEVALPISFSDMLAQAKGADLSLFCYEGDGTLSMKRVLEENGGVKTLSVIVGPEGGFSLDEAEQAKSASLTPVNLGPRILRCETAPIYALSSLSFFFEL